MFLSSTGKQKGSIERGRLGRLYYREIFARSKFSRFSRPTIKMRKYEEQKFQHVNFCVKNWTRRNFRTCVLCAIVSLDLMTALHRYFKPADDVLPSPTGDLSASVSPATIKGRGPKFALALNAKISSGGETGKIWTRENFRYTVFR